MNANDMLSSAWAAGYGRPAGTAHAVGDVKEPVPHAADVPCNEAGGRVGGAASEPTPAPHVDGGAVPSDPLPERGPPDHNLLRAMELYQTPWLNPADVPTLRLNAIRISGLRNVRPWFLAAICRPYVDPTAPASPLAVLYGDRTSSPLPGQPTDFHALLEAATAISGDLARLDLVKDIAAQLQPSQFDNGAHPTEVVDIVLQVKPASRFFLKTNTSVGNSEGTASIQGKLRNVFGGAETLEGSATLGTRTRHAYHAVFSSPVFASPELWGSISLLAQDRDLTGYLSAHEAQDVARAATMWTRGDGTRHELAYELGHRHFHHMLPGTSLGIRKLAKPTLKSAVSYTVEVDTRDDPLFTTAGRYVKGVLEYAGLGGDTSFVKAEGFSSISRAFGNGWAWSLGARTGALHSLDGRPPCLSDRFMLGGPTCVRMFRLNSLGPKEQQNSLGGDAYWVAGASLLMPFPRRPTWPVKLHSFINAGQLAQTERNPGLAQRPFARSLAELTQPSASVGLGLLFQQGPVRVELNFGLPLVARRGDGARKGLQFGVGVEFL
ncbi:hypothetical protein MSPP1_004217 [Malassezia sp. CBS 17886]|nr:hypothetical protein MSPP1_004217 [Malassezia sp. CBS 17886]